MFGIPDTHLDLLADETRSFAFLATTMDDGSPQVTPIWFNTDGDDILINSAQGRVKDRNMRARPQIAIAIVDPKNPYRYMQIRGRVVEMNTENGWAHIDALAKKYTGSDHFTPNSDDEIRVVYRVRLERVHVTG